MKNARAHLVDVALHLRVEVLEKVFEEQREQSACELEPLVAVVILVRKVARVVHRHEAAPDHETNVDSLVPEVVRHDRDVRHDHRVHHFPCFVHFRALEAAAAPGLKVAADRRKYEIGENM